MKSSRITGGARPMTTRPDTVVASSALASISSGSKPTAARITITSRPHARCLRAAGQDYIKEQGQVGFRASHLAITSSRGKRGQECARARRRTPGHAMSLVFSNLHGFTNRHARGF